ncbi:Rhodanese-like domain containing protein [Aphelenchoides avenae]|nr:Rhodanese-like domain containing protein [Aphelenchus avenae]
MFSTATNGNSPMRSANPPGGLHGTNTTIISATSPDAYAPLRRVRSTFEHHSPPAFEEQRLMLASFGGSSHATAAATVASSSIAALLFGDENDDVGRRPAKSVELLNTSFSRTLSASVLEYRPITHDDTRPPKSEEVVYSLETVERPQVDSQAFRSIAPRTLARLLASEDFPSKYRLIDCRYPFEYMGGHIKHAENIHDPSEIATEFYPVDARIPIFYCEYSQKRGPTMGHALRRYDRELNRERYPLMDYPEMYLVDQGYRHFYEEYSGQGLCVPDHYVRMRDKRHRKELDGFSQHRRRREAKTKVIAGGDAKSRVPKLRGLKLRDLNRDYSAEELGSKEYKPLRLEKIDECVNKNAQTPKGRSLFGKGKVTTRSFFSRLSSLEPSSSHASGTSTGPQAGRSALRPPTTASPDSNAMDTFDPLEALQELQEQEELDVSMSSDLGSPPPVDRCPIGVLSFS